MSPTREGHVLNWASELDGKAMAQAQRAATMPFVVDLALMPDAHYGLGATIGSVIATQGALMPAAVGVDIGCGMIAVQITLVADLLPDDLRPLLSEIEQVVPAGVGRGHRSHRQSLKKTSGEYWADANPNERVTSLDLWDKTINQFGTLGSGNHFVEVCLDERDVVWVVLHSGSRGVGNQLARGHIDTAKGLMKERFIFLEDPDLAYLVEGDPQFRAYVKDLLWAQDYAAANREQMMDAVLRAFEGVIAGEVSEVQRINCHHNYAVREHHRGLNVWVTRKGAIRARANDLGVIPGSMGTSSYIVRGLGSKASFESAAHGAGRRMSRTEAKATYTEADLTDVMGERTWLAKRGGKLIDEIPMAYKDIDQVMSDQSDLVEIVHTLNQVLNYKGT